MEDDTEQLPVLYQHIIDCAIGTMAKSTPPADRKACALEAFHTAVKDYRLGYGDLALYLEVSPSDGGQQAVYLRLSSPLSEPAPIRLCGQRFLSL